jgi:hypothetical protein
MDKSTAFAWRKMRLADLWPAKIRTPQKFAGARDQEDVA